MNRIDGEAGRHAFDGQWAPGRRALIYSAQETFSVGIFEWLPKSNGKGVKRGPVKVRVKGSVINPGRVTQRAEEIAAQLDAGTYAGPKNVDVRAR